MRPRSWKKISKEILILRIGALPGIAIIGLVIIARLTGSMQSLEWLVFDNFLRLRPQEPIDKRIVIVGINEDDIRSRKDQPIDSPISDHDLAKLLMKLHTYSPAVIGLDIYRDLPVNPGNTELLSAFSKIHNLIAIEKVLPDQVAPPSALPPEQIGFADQLTDIDGKLRRSLLATPTDKGYKLSLSLRLASAYLALRGISLENGIHNHTAMQFGNTELPQFLPDSGAYVGADAGGYQILINFRSGGERFKTLSWSDIKGGDFDPKSIKSKIVIIGMTAPSRKDFITTSAVTTFKPATGRVYGVEIQAHVISQIISAVLDSRPLLNTWDKQWEYLWIVSWGFLGILIARLTQSPLLNLVVTSLAVCILVVTTYLLLIWGWWVPLIPAILVLSVNGISLTSVYQYDQALKLGLQARQVVIERTFETIHNGPLQSLAKVLKLFRGEDLPINKLLPELEKELEKLNHELRGIYEFLQQEPPSQDWSLYLGKNLVINLQYPLHEILYQVYSHTLERDFPYFRTIKVKICTFEPIEDKSLGIENKRGICRFLEEALCNVGKHATGVTCLQVTCSAAQGWQTLTIVYNGLGTNSSREGRGTQQSKYLAQEIQGKFRRISLAPRGTLCELSWPMASF